MLSTTTPYLRHNISGCMETTLSTSIPYQKGYSNGDKPVQRNIKQQSKIKLCLRCGLNWFGTDYIHENIRYMYLCMYLHVHCTALGSCMAMKPATLLEINIQN